MTTKTSQRTRTKVRDLHSWIPAVAPFEGESTFDASSQAAPFLAAFSSAIRKKDWAAFAELFADECWWRDSLTLTFDKRTIQGRDSIVHAWETLSETRRPGAFSVDKDDVMDMEAAFVRLSPAFATLDVPFAFRTETPASRCIGQAKLIPDEKGGWKVWVLATAVVELTEKPFQTLPRQAPSVIGEEQRGKSHAQGLPKLEAGTVLDAIVVGGSCNGISNGIRLDSAGAEVAVFEGERQAGGNWLTQRYDSLTLHHPSSMYGLPQFPVPKNEGYSEYMTSKEMARYLCAAVEALKVPFFAGVKVLSNKWDAEEKLWTVTVRETETGEEVVLKARNVVVSTGFIVSRENLKWPQMKDREAFKGPVQHTAEYHNPGLYKGKRVLVIGSGNSSHDVCGDLALNGDVKSVTMLQRSPTVLVEFKNLIEMFSMRYKGQMPIDAADFLETALPMGVMRDMARGVMAGVVAASTELNEQLANKGYLLDKTPCLIERQYEDRGRAFYMDQPGTFNLVFEDKIKIARGEARGFVDGGVVVVDLETGEERVVEADAVIYATGYEEIDLPQRYADSGFVDQESAAKLENVSKFGIDEEGEPPGYITFSGHPNFYFSGIGIFMNRWNSKYTAVQVLADVIGQFPERYTRPAK